MCWFYRVRYSCGGEVWGDRQRQCARSIKSERTTTEPPCSMRRPARRLLNLSECPVCSGEILLDTNGGQEHAGVTSESIRQYPNPRGMIPRWESWLPHLRRLELNKQLTIHQAYKHFADVLCVQCNLNPGHKGEHKLKCPQIDCNLEFGHEGPHGLLDKFRWCNLLDCTRELNHPGPHRMAQQQTPRSTSDSSLASDNSPILDSRDLTAGEGHRQLEELDRKVLEGMTGSNSLTKHQSFAGVQANLRRQQKLESGSDGTSNRHIDVLPLDNSQRLIVSSPYNRLDQASNQIRLFKLDPCRAGNKITGSFLYACIENSPSYTALSYAWGDGVAAGTIGVGRDDNPRLGTDLGVADNLLRFLRVQSHMITEPKLFWIDAICINQSDIRERNHQVGLMKLIYINADDVHVWLGPEADDSKIAMGFLSRGGPEPLRPRGSGFYPVWTPREARALGDLCERPYWRRMWIIQEVIHADKIRVWCGEQSADWTVFDKLYCTLKTLDDMSWATHHRHAIAVLQSSALTMVWQRAHWRHPETPVPTLQTLVEVFQEWKCSDLRDKVYALVGIAATGTAVVPDYSRSARQVYLDVIDSDDVVDKPKFCNLLSQLLGLSKEDADLDSQSL